MDISPKTTAYAVDDPSWLGSAHGTDSPESCTLLVSAFVDETHYPSGFMPGGLPLGKITASGKFGPYDDEAVDGTETLVGHLYGAVDVQAGATNIGAAILTHGKVKESRLPLAVDAAGKVDVAGRIRYI